jgi:hypothetical protein
MEYGYIYERTIPHKPQVAARHGYCHVENNHIVYEVAAELGETQSAATTTPAAATGTTARATTRAGELCQRINRININKVMII